MSNANRILQINEQIAKLEAELFSLVTAPEVTVTVTGPPGSGKTTICALIYNALQDKIASTDNISIEIEKNGLKQPSFYFDEFNELVAKIEDYDFQLNRKIKIVDKSGE